MMEILLIIQITITVLLIGAILMQRSTSDGLLTGGGNSFMTGKESANFMSRATAILATIFMVNSLVLAYAASHTERNASLLDTIATEAESIPVETKDSSPVVPMAE